MPHEPKNLPASVRQKLLDLARSRNEDFGLILGSVDECNSLSVEPLAFECTKPTASCSYSDKVFVPLTLNVPATAGAPVFG